MGEDSMHRVGAWIAAFALLLGTGLNTAWAGDPDWPGSTEDKPAAGGGHVPDNWFTRWVRSLKRHDPPKSEPRKPETKGEKGDKDPVVKTTPNRPVNQVENLSAQRQHEQDILLRRLSTCDKLEEIAYHTNDEELQRKVDQLKERVQTAYSQRIANLSGSATRFESDENCLENHLGAGAPVNNRHQAGGPPSTVNEKDRNARAAAKEDKP
jgi:hypothetical protein